MALSKSASGYQDFPPEQIIKKKIWNFYPHHRSYVSFFSFNVQIYWTALISACDGLQRIAESRYHVPWPHNVTVSPPPDAIIMVAISGTIIDPPDYGYRSLQVIFEAMFIFKSPFFWQHARFKFPYQYSWMSSSKSKQSKYWAIIFVLCFTSTNYTRQVL